MSLLCSRCALTSPHVCHKRDQNEGGFGSAHHAIAFRETEEGAGEGEECKCVSGFAHAKQ